MSVKNKAPSRANPKVYARGENSFPSTFSKEKTGIRAVMMMSLEKKIAFPISTLVRLIMPSFATLLNFSIPISIA